MKRLGQLWAEIIDFENLLLAARKAQKGKRFRDNVLAFNDRREEHLLQLQAELQNQIYQPGGYRTFQIFEPKPRLISAAPYRDRVVHHALCNVIVPGIEQSFITDSYANRLGYGSHRALQRFTAFARSHRYILQCDVQKYFASIDHEILKMQLRRKIKCPQTLWLVDLLIDASNEQESVYEYFTGDDLLTPLRRRGLPIGNLTSQFFANVYLNGFDHFVKETLRSRHYVRYVDDFALFSNNLDSLRYARGEIDTYLASLRLKAHPVKTQLFETQRGATFLGFRVLPDRIRVRSDNLRKGKKRLKQLKADFTAGKIERHALAQSLQSWLAHLAHADSWRLRQKLLQELDLSDFEPTHL
jgi:RNA-directed DNA polymerase